MNESCKGKSVWIRMLRPLMTLRGRLFSIRDAMQRWILPELRYSQSFYEDRLCEHASDIDSWLDIGCGHQLLPTWRGAAESKLAAAVPLTVGVDFDFDSLRRHRTLRNVVR